jgi:ribose 5-phosphate isomerase B
MNKLKNIAIGADHRGFLQKQQLQKLITHDIDLVNWIDVGAFNQERSDYPVYAQLVCQAMISGKADYGVLLCGSGVGMAIAANRYKKIYAALAWNQEVAALSRQHDHANVLVLPSDFVLLDDAAVMIRAWLQAQPLPGRYEKRIEMIDNLR